ncbi:hypothetical protein H7X87_01235 [Acetobacteraceae bacterium]|nr:hypothetical protein [Candidatus Parcubacteria bacterium]
MQKPDFEAIAKTFSLKTLPDSEIELTGEVPPDAIGAYQDEALTHMAEHVDLPGFRKGKVPKDMVLKRVGETAVLEEATEHFMQEFYPLLLAWHKVDAVGRPEIKITKLAPGNPVGITVLAAVYPLILIPKDWKKIGEGIVAEATLPATDEEVDKTIEDLRQSRRSPGGPSSANPTEDGPPGELPELNDEFAKSLGAFENLDALKAQIKKGIGEEKERGARDARRGKIIDAILEKTKVEVPRVFIESELEKILAQMKDDIARFNIKFEDYLKQINKTEEDLRNEFRQQAKKRAKLQLTLNKIAEEEKVEADATAIEAEMKHAFEHFPQARPDLVRVHIETVLRNEQVLKLLEGEVKTA